MTKQYNLKNIRAFLADGFSAQELLALCFFSPTFKPVCNQINSSAGKNEIIHQLIQYADQKLEFESLLDEAKNLNYKQYQNHQPYEISTPKQIPPTPDYPYQEFQTFFRDIIAPKRYTASNSVLNLVFGNISDIREMTVTIPINQDFDFEQRGPRSVLASFENILVGKEYFFDVLKKIWPAGQRPSQAGTGRTQFLQLPPNSCSLDRVIFVVTTRNLSRSPSHYGRYVNTPIQGIDYVLDKVLETAMEKRIMSIALPLLGTGYAKVDIDIRSHSELQLLLRQIVLALTIHKLEGHLTNKDCELKRGVIVVYSSQPSGEDEHKIWDFVSVLNYSQK